MDAKETQGRLGYTSITLYLAPTCKTCMAYDSLFDGVCSGAVPWGVLMLDILVSPVDGLGVLGVLPAYVSVRQRTSAYVSVRQHTSAYVSSTFVSGLVTV